MLYSLEEWDSVCIIPQEIGQNGQLFNISAKYIIRGIPWRAWFIPDMKLVDIFHTNKTVFALFSLWDK